MNCKWCGKSIVKDQLYLKRVFEDKKLFFCSDECFISKMFSLPLRMVEIFEKIVSDLPTLELADLNNLISNELESNRKIVESGNVRMGLRKKQ